MNPNDKFFALLEKWFPWLWFAGTLVLVLVTIPLIVFLWVYMFRVLCS